MVRVPKRFVDETLWPEYRELDQALRDALDRVTDQTIANVFQQETSEAEERDEPRMMEAVGSGDRE
jgi:hypothetical protein